MEWVNETGFDQTINFYGLFATCEPDATGDNGRVLTADFLATPQTINAGQSFKWTPEIIDKSDGQPW
jgi:hypothetical protein